MNNPICGKAIEAAAIELAKKWNLWPADAERMAREAVLAAYPAIREAVVGEFKGLVETWRSTALADHEAFGKTQDSTARLIVAKADQRLSCADRLAALTEQENRNG